MRINRADFDINERYPSLVERMKKNGVSKRKRASDYPAILAMWRENVTYKEIGARFGVSGFMAKLLVCHALAAEAAGVL